MDSTSRHKGKSEMPGKETNPSSQKVDLMSHPGHPIVKPTPRRPNAGKVGKVSKLSADGEGTKDLEMAKLGI